jgi:RHS repeat-associated protein
VQPTSPEALEAAADQRFYASTYGRFNSPDPYQASPTGATDPKAPQSWNRFAYVVGDPINNYDPRGLVPCPPGSGNTCVETVASPDPVPYDYSPIGGHYVGVQPALTVTGWDADHGVLPKCGTLPNAPQGLNGSTIQNNINQAQQVLSSDLTMPDPEGGGASGVLAFLGYLTAQFAPGGAWDYKSQTQYGSSAQNFGNFNFGAVMASLGASYYQTQNAAGVAQIGICLFGGACGTGVPGVVFPFGDQVSDAAQIKQGWNYESNVMAGCNP